MEKLEARESKQDFRMLFHTFVSKQFPHCKIIFFFREKNIVLEQVLVEVEYLTTDSGMRENPKFVLLSSICIDHEARSSALLPGYHA